MKLPNTKASFARATVLAVGFLSSSTLLIACHGAVMPEKPQANTEGDIICPSAHAENEAKHLNPIVESHLDRPMADIEVDSDSSYFDDERELDSSDFDDEREFDSLDFDGETDFDDGIEENAVFKHEAGLTQSSSCNAYKAYLIKTQALKYARRLYIPTPRRQYSVSQTSHSKASDNNFEVSKQVGEYTTTNLQEAGVDEMDILKSDGVYIYVIESDGVRVLKAWPASELVELTVINFAEEEDAQSFKAEGLLLIDQRLIVLRTNLNEKNRFSTALPKGGPPYFIGDKGFYIDVYDVTKPERPVLMQSLSFDGDFKTARNVNGRIYVVMDHYLDAAYFNDLLEDDELDDLFDEPRVDEEFKRLSRMGPQSLVDHAVPIIEKFLTKKMAKSKLETWLPVYTQQKGSQHSEQALLSCKNIYLPKTASKDQGLLSIIELSGGDFSQVRALAVADSDWLVYASDKNIYAVASSGNWFWSCFSDGFCNGFSHIHRFQFGGPKGHIKYVNSGEIEGSVEDSFWMSEYHDHLRVATGESVWDSNTGSSLSVLSLKGPKLRQVGRIDGIAPGEDIYAARMFGDKGYLVTFKDIDPLFTVDLSHPKAPKIMGELKINGYSSYIHPLGEDALLTIGKDADDHGVQEGLQLQIFDVSDMEKPTRSHQYLIATDGSGSFSSSVALYEHHAFSFHAPSGLLAIPINVAQWSHWKSGSNFSGMLILKVTKDKGFEELGLIDHAEFQSDPDAWWDDLKRSHFMFTEAGAYDKNAFVYTLSAGGIKVSNANQPSEEVAKLAFKEQAKAQDETQ